MTENLAGRGEGLAGLVVPPIWRIERCTKHENYVPDCCLCNEEILTIKTEKAYRAGFRAALEAAAPPSTPDMADSFQAVLVAYGVYDSFNATTMERMVNDLLALATPSPQAPPKEQK